MTMKSRSLSIATIMVLAMLMMLVPSSQAQMPTGKDHVKFQPIERISGNAGDTVLVSVKFKIERHDKKYRATQIIRNG